MRLLHTVSIWAAWNCLFACIRASSRAMSRRAASARAQSRLEHHRFDVDPREARQSTLCARSCACDRRPKGLSVRWRAATLPAPRLSSSRLAAVSMQVRANSGSSCAALAPPTFWRAVFQACSLSRSGSPRPSCQQRTKHELPCFALPCLALLCFALLCFTWLGLPPSSSYSSKSSEKAKRLEFQAPSSRRLERRPSRFRDRARLSLEISTHSHFAPILLGSWLDSSGSARMRFAAFSSGDSASGSVRLGLKLGLSAGAGATTQPTTDPERISTGAPLSHHSQFTHPPTHTHTLSLGAFSPSPPLVPSIVIHHPRPSLPSLTFPSNLATQSSAKAPCTRPASASAPASWPTTTTPPLLVAIAGRDLEATPSCCCCCFSSSPPPTLCPMRS
ncbi:hypothetical protein L1887_56989 [Cichorium endivia]|nr:hypothetical protein L1887_56989 [Cichorium endivia]